MEFLINPNISYVLLILGFVTAILALFSPGTGVLELGALVMLALAGYGIANLPINSWAFAIMALGIIPLVLALVRARKNTHRRSVPLMLLAVLAFLVGAALLYQGSTWLSAVNPILILLLSLGTLGLTWLMATKLMEAASSQPAFDLDQLIGMTGQVSSDIRGQGTVYVNGEEWSAFSDHFIPAGSSVRVLRREGLALEIEPIKH